jgi:tRNAThr (cytosine32-N3)-methyltransferase
MRSNTDKSFKLRPNLYARGDKTRVYFFEKEELQEMFSPSVESSDSTADTTYRFETVRLGVDRRLLMNRKRMLKMYRVWMQGIFRKPLNAESPSA